MLATLYRPSDRHALIRRLQRLEPDSPRSWGRMTPHEMLCHLADGYRIALGERETGLVRTRYPRTLLRWYGLYVPVAWPVGLPAPPEIKAHRSGTRPTEFERDRAELETLLERMAVSRPRVRGRTHPLLGRMSGWEWGRWSWLHADHHLRQFGCL